MTRSKGPEKIYVQVSVRFSPELGAIVQMLAEKNGRSCCKEVIRLVEAQLEQEKGTIDTSALER